MLCPTMGKVKIAQTLALRGPAPGATTVGRMLKEPASSPPPGDDEASVEAGPEPRKRIVTAKYPNHVWHVDLTTVPLGGFWVTWLPFALPQRWPFCWWVACAVDHFSRRVMGFAVFGKQPTSKQVRMFLARTIRRAKATPKYIVCDKGVQFWCKPFKLWSRRRRIRPRFGAIGQHGSIAVVERFIRTMKEQCFRSGIVPMRQAAMQASFLPMPTGTIAFVRTPASPAARRRSDTENRIRLPQAAIRAAAWLVNDFRLRLAAGQGARAARCQAQLASATTRANDTCRSSRCSAA